MAHLYCISREKMTHLTPGCLESKILPMVRRTNILRARLPGKTQSHYSYIPPFIINTCTHLWTRRPVWKTPCLHHRFFLTQPQHLYACCGGQIRRLRNCQVGYYNNVHVASFLSESNHTLPHLKYNYVMGDVSACGGGGGRWAGTTWTKED